MRIRPGSIVFAGCAALLHVGMLAARAPATRRQWRPANACNWADSTGFTSIWTES